MDNPSNNFPEKQTWGTKEELLLACAVHRYGTQNWISVATEVQKRSSKFQLLTPLSCQQKYNDLKRRFSGDDAGSIPADKSDDAIPWLDQLKKLRVAELKRELQLFDISIVSLQLKVERLIEEREGRETEDGEKRKRIEENEPESLTDKPDGGEESERENRSVNESNSTDQKAEKTAKEPGPIEPVRVEPEGVGSEGVKAAGEDSCNGSCGSAAKELERNTDRVDSAELGESAAESMGRESGDVLSFVSLSGEKVKSEEPEGVEPANGEDQSPAATKRICVESQPLVECIEIIRSHKFGTFFERLDVIKETPKYRSFIRQHTDLETIRTRLEENWYSRSNSSFFRDLLLLFNNVIIFFDKNSSESAAAVELRQIVLKAMTRNTFDPNSAMREQYLEFPAAQNVKLDVQSSDFLLSKPNILAPLIACRKRSSITAKRAVLMSSSLEAKKKEHTESSIGKNTVSSSVKSDDGYRATKKRTRERSATGTGSSSKNRKTRGNMKNLDVDINADDSSDVEETECENSDRKTKANVNAKKRSAEIFLSRITRSSTLKDSVVSSEDGKGERAEQKKKAEHKKKKGNGKIDAKKEQIVQKRSGGKQGEEMEGPVKKIGGRLTKRGAVPEAVGAEVFRGKRRKESVEARKRSRK